MLESMKALIQNQDMLPPGCTVLCAVSGGADSICLLHALYHLRHSLDFTLAAAHFNHQLRGEDSDRDEAFVAQFVALCCGHQRLSDGTLLPCVPLYTGCGDVAGQAKQLGMGIEEAARTARYDFLRQTAAQAGCDVIATAHTADDNAETILFHLARGSGLRGLTGIPPAPAQLIRPLLTTTRRQVEDYLAYHGLPHVDDRTNLDQRYTRNRIRHQVIPILDQLCPGFSSRVADTAALLRDDEAYLTDQAQLLADQAVDTGTALSLSAQLLAQAPPPLASRAVRLLIARFLGGNSDCSRHHLQGVLALCRSSDPSAQIHLPGGLLARREYDRLVMTPMLLPSVAPPTTLAMPGETRWGSWILRCTRQQYTGQLHTPVDFWLDGTQHAALTLSSRQPGQTLTLAGRPRKRVKKWCIDLKIPAHLRSALPVLALDGGRVAAVVGLGPEACLLPQPGTQAWHITATQTIKQEYTSFGKEETPYVRERYPGDSI